MPTETLSVKNKGESKFLEACVNGKLERVKTMLKDRSAYVNAEDSKGNCALLLAVVTTQSASFHSIK